MKYKKTHCKPFSAKVTFGLERGYTGKVIKKESVIKFIQQQQNALIKDKGIHLSVSLIKCSIVLSGQNEPHLLLSFINYPKFPLKEEILKTEIENLLQLMMSEFNQNRVVIEYLNNTTMLESSSGIDPRITYI
jgi:hypothetical protein